MSLEKVLENSITLNSAVILAGRYANGAIYNAITETSGIKARALALPASVAEVAISSLSKFIGIFELAGRAVYQIALSPFKDDKTIRMGVLYLTASLNAIGSLAITLLLSPVAIIFQTASVLFNPKEAMTFEKQALITQSIFSDASKGKDNEEQSKFLAKAIAGV
jgi:hypothetical protein